MVKIETGIRTVDEMSRLPKWNGMEWGSCLVTSSWRETGKEGVRCHVLALKLSWRNVCCVSGAKIKVEGLRIAVSLSSDGKIDTGMIYLNCTASHCIVLLY